MAVASRFAVAGAVALLALLAVEAASAQALPGNSFAVTDRTLYLSAERGSTAGQSGVLLLAEEAPAQQGSVSFVAPGVDVLGVVQQQSRETWYTVGGWDQDLELVDDATALLYFQANPQAATDVTVSLYDVAPDGQAVLVASDAHQFVTLLSGTAVQFRMATNGLHLLQGHVIGLEVAAEASHVAVVLQFGGPTPSALTLSTRWLDSDGDKAPDSREVLVGRNPLAADGPEADGGDSDADGLSDQAEGVLGTDPADADTDGDSWGDGLEANAGSDPLDADVVPIDGDEDGLPDNFESTYFGDDAALPGEDPDGDGCVNLREASYGTDPADHDTDDDGISDCEELEDGTDPVNAASFLHGAGSPPEPAFAAAAFAVGSTLCLVPLIRRP